MLELKKIIDSLIDFVISISICVLASVYNDHGITAQTVKCVTMPALGREVELIKYNKNGPDDTSV